MSEANLFIHSIKKSSRKYKEIKKCISKDFKLPILALINLIMKINDLSMIDEMLFYHVVY
jgi:hypothetical protein